MRLVVVFKYSDWERGPYEETFPIVYDSPEALIVHIDEQWKAYHQAKVKYDQDMQEWYNKKPLHRLVDELVGVPSASANKSKEWGLIEPEPPEGQIEIGGQIFWAYEIQELPTILTLDEWFNKVENQ